MVINTWVTQCCCILYCTVYSIHTRETRYTRTRKYTTHSLVSQNARIIFAVFLGAIADGAFREWPLSTDHTRDLCEIAAPRRCPLQIPAEIFADGGLCLWPRLRSTDAETQVLARFPYSAAFLVPKSAARKSALQPHLQAASARGSDKSNASAPGWAEAMALRSEPTGGRSAHR